MVCGNGKSMCEYFFYFYGFSKIPPFNYVCNHLFIGKNFIWLKGKTNKDQPLDFKNKSQQFIC